MVKTKFTLGGTILKNNHFYYQAIFYTSMGVCRKKLRLLNLKCSIMHCLIKRYEWKSYP